jgi:acyl-CoA thioester hydrolase
MKIKVYYEDTDAAGVVYYANYLRFLERGRTEFLLDQQIDVADFHNKGYMFAVVHVDIHYRKPALLGEIIEVLTELKEITSVTITMKQDIYRGDTLLSEATVKLACINKDGKPRRLPSEVTSLFSDRLRRREGG